jgi:hypothetical protein
MIIEQRENNQFFLDGKRINQQVLNVVLEQNPFAVILSGHQKIDVTLDVRKKLREMLWTEEELKIFRENFGKITLESLKTLLPNKRAGQLRNKASELSLTKEKDLWTEEEDKNLLELRRYHVPFDTVSRLLSRPQRSCEVRAHRLGGTHTDGIKSKDGKDESRAIMKYSVSTSTKGRAAELMVSIELALRGVDVFEPFYPQHKVDLLAYTSGRIYKVQVKSAVFLPDTDRFRLPLKTKNPRTHKREFYKPEEVDFFIAVCLGDENVFYIIPYDDVKTRGDLNFYPHRVVSGQADRIGMEMYRGAWHLIAGLGETSQSDNEK